MIPLDTTPAAAALQESAYRRMGPVRRLQAALQLSDLTHAMAHAGMRRRYPEYSDEQIVETLARQMYDQPR